jgi:hypothetical protein
VGVPPDVSVPASKALDEAQVLALQKLAATPGENSKDYTWALEAANARLVPVKLDASAMPAYVGAYGVRSITLRDGALVFQRQGRPALTMTPMANDLFTLGDGDHVRLRFHRADGKVTGFDMISPDGHMVTADRSS